MSKSSFLSIKSVVFYYRIAPAARETAERSQCSAVACCGILMHELSFFNAKITNFNTEIIIFQSKIHQFQWNIITVHHIIIIRPPDNTKCQASKRPQPRPPKNRCFSRVVHEFRSLASQGADLVEVSDLVQRATTGAVLDPL